MASWWMAKLLGDWQGRAELLALGIDLGDTLKSVKGGWYLSFPIYLGELRYKIYPL